MTLLAGNLLIHPALFLTCPTNQLCAARPLIINWINSACVAIMFIKSNRILIVFKSQIRMTHDEMKRWNALYLFQLFLFVSISNAIAFISLVVEPAQVVHELDHQRYTRWLRCNTESHNHFQVYYLILLQVFPAVQAFRGRHLPGPFNEAMSIVYLTFISTTIYTISIPIYNYQQKERSTAILNWLVSILVCLIQLLLLYAKKTYIILFKQHKNTKDYVRTRMQDDILQNKK